MNNNEMCAAYFKGQTAFSRCFLEFEKKWKSYGRVAGIIILKNASEKERKAIGGIIGKTFYEDTVRFSFSEFEQGLQKTRFAPVDMKKLLETYFGKMLVSKGEQEKEVKEYVSVDVETTGLSPKQDKIIEIGAVRVRDGQIVGSFTCFVNPGRILPAHITELTGILQEQVDEAETMESVLPAFLEFAGDLPLVGHRILFDYGFLKRAAVNMRLDFERSGVDTLKLSRQFLSELPSRRLSALCEHFEIPIQAHRALEDARATHILYEKLLELYGTGPDRAKAFEPVPLICKVKRESPATKAQKERLKKLISMHQLVPEYDVEMLTKNEASRQIDRILAAYGSLQK